MRTATATGPVMIELDRIVTALRALGAADIGAQIAKKAAPLLQAAVLQTLSAGQSPEGVAWAERKAGGRAYAHAASRIETQPHGDLVRMVLKGPEVFGHFGARGMPVRQMLPDAGAKIPASVEKAITDAAKAVIAEALNE